MVPWRYRHAPNGAQFYALCSGNGVIVREIAKFQTGWSSSDFSASRIGRSSETKLRTKSHVFVLLVRNGTCLLFQWIADELNWAQFQVFFLRKHLCGLKLTRPKAIWHAFVELSFD